MSSKKCPKCGLMNFAYADVCKRCGETSLTEDSTDVSTLSHSAKTVAANNKNNGCPQCQSEQTSSFEMVYMQGTTQGKLKATTYEFGEGFGVMGGKTSSQSVIAQKCTPPASPANLYGVSALVAVIGFGMFLCSRSIAMLVGVGVIAAGIFYYSQKQNKVLTEQHQLALLRWKRSWICLRCGSAWQRA